MCFAALDIGTVTCRLLIADVCVGQLIERERRVAITNLGIGVDATGMLQPDAIERVATQIAEYKRCIDSYCDEEHPSIPMYAVATSAARDASNAQELIDALADVGVSLSIIEGSREAQLSFMGASAAFAGQDIMVVDIGGGSTEVIVGKGAEAPAFAHSFNIGCRRITERFLTSNPPTTMQCVEARNWAREIMEPVFSQIASQGLSIGKIVAVAGTATSTVSIDKSMEVYDSSVVDGTVVTRKTLEGIYERLRTMPLAERKQVVGLEPQRASVIVAGLAILLEVLSLAQCGEYTVSESDILQGIIMDAAQRGA